MFSVETLITNFLNIHRELIALFFSQQKMCFPRRNSYFRNLLPFVIYGLHGKAAIGYWGVGSWDGGENSETTEMNYPGVIHLVARPIIHVILGVVG